MNTVVVHGLTNIWEYPGKPSGTAFEIPIHLRPQIAEIVNAWPGASNAVNSTKHQKICELLSLQRFFPATSHKPYALQATTIKLMDSGGCIAMYGGWYECYKCHENIDNKPQGLRCPKCGETSLPNFRAEVKPELKKKR